MIRKQLKKQYPNWYLLSKKEKKRVVPLHKEIMNWDGIGIGAATTGRSSHAPPSIRIVHQGGSAFGRLSKTISGMGATENSVRYTDQ
ncbi:MAG: hypothetical protein DSY57_05670 [Desulfobulbus sp.]|nr:MAG: hypothetical protein DSY57_05670 [Desulfobulbus sp.]